MIVTTAKRNHVPRGELWPLLHAIAASDDATAPRLLDAHPRFAAQPSPAGSKNWNPRAQAAMVRYLIGAGADPNAADKAGVTAAGAPPPASNKPRSSTC